MRILSHFDFRLLSSTLARINAVLPWGLRKSIIFVFFLMTFGGIVEVASIFSLTLFFRLIYSPEFLLEFPITQELMQEWPAIAEIMKDPREIMLWGCALPVALIVLKNIVWSIVTWKSALLSQRVSAYIGNSIMDKYLYMPYSWHLSAQNAHAVLAMQRRFSLGNVLLNLLTCYSSLITICLLFIGIFFYAPEVTIGTVVSMFAISILTYGLLNKNIKKSGELSAREQEGESVATQTALDGVREIIIYQKQPIFLKEIAKHVKDGMRPRTFLAITPTVPTWTLESGGFFLIWATIYAMFYFSDSSHADISETVALLALTAWRVLPAMNRIVGSIVAIKGERPVATPCLDYMESLNSSSAPSARIEAEEGFRPKKDIVFDNITFTYPGAKEPALKKISCRIPIGHTIGLVGRSGSGKTTFINVLCGLLEAQEGKFLVDGRELTPGQLISYRKKIGYVPQSPYMLGGSVAQNVAFSDWGQEIDQDRVAESCKGAAIDFLGENFEHIDNIASANLSGGQKQRVSIARALYTNPIMLIFDEATSALDQEAEARVQEAMYKSSQGRSNVIAAHRLETLEICDIIFWFDEGRIIKMGPAKEILPLYKHVLLESASNS